MAKGKDLNRGSAYEKKMSRGTVTEMDLSQKRLEFGNLF